MRKPTPAHHKRVRVPFEEVADGYCGDRKIRQAGPGWWQIIGADPEPTPGYAQWPAVHNTIGIIVAPARGAAK